MPMLSSYCQYRLTISSSVLFLGLLAGGPAAIWFVAPIISLCRTYNFSRSSHIITIVFMMITAFVLAEICSALPLSGSIYIWAAESAGPKYARFFGFVVAWWSCTAWMTFAAGNCQVRRPHTHQEVSDLSPDHGQLHCLSAQCLGSRFPWRCHHSERQISCFHLGHLRGIAGRCHCHQLPSTTHVLCRLQDFVGIDDRGLPSMPDLAPHWRFSHLRLQVRVRSFHSDL